MLLFLQTHPLLGALLGAVVALAVVGMWYVISHHLKAIVITLVCAAGAASGVIVFWRGIGNDLPDLIAIGAFLMVVFPVFNYQAIRTQQRKSDMSVRPLPGLKSDGTTPRRAA